MTPHTQNFTQKMDWVLRCPYRGRGVPPQSIPNSVKRDVAVYKVYLRPCKFHKFIICKSHFPQHPLKFQKLKVKLISPFLQLNHQTNKTKAMWWCKPTNIEEYVNDTS